MTPLRFALVSIVGVLLSEGSENRLNMTIPVRFLFHIELCERKLCWYVLHVFIYCKNMKSSLFPLRPPVPHVSGSLNFSCSAWMLLQRVIPQFSDGSLSTSRMEGLSLSKRSHMVAMQSLKQRVGLKILFVCPGGLCFPRGSPNFIDGRNQDRPRCCSPSSSPCRPMAPHGRDTSLPKVPQSLHFQNRMSASLK